MTANILSVVTGKGGVGKTTISFNLCGALSELGKKVLLIDGDYEKPDAIGISNQSEKGLSFNLLHTDYENIKEQISEEKNKYDFIIIDTPPNFDVNALKVCIVCDLVLIPAAPSLSDENAVAKTIQFINTVEKPFKIVANKIVKNQKLSNTLLNEINKTEVALRSYITVKVALQESAYDGKYVGDYLNNSQSHVEFKRLGEELLKLF